MDDIPPLANHVIQFAAFEHQPTPIIILSDVATIVVANSACQQLFQFHHNLVGTPVKDLPIVWQDGTHEAFLGLLAVDPNHVKPDMIDHEGPPTVLKLQVDICKELSTSITSARLLVTTFCVSGISYRMLSFENTREDHTVHIQSPGSECSQNVLDPAMVLAAGRKSGEPSRGYSGTRGSTATTQDHLDTRFSQFRDAVYFNSEDKAGFLLSADETFCFPSYKSGTPDVTPVEIDDIEIFFANWDVWDPDFTKKEDLSEFPSIWLNRHRTKFRNRRYGLREGGKEIVLETSGDPLYDTQTGEYIGGVVWLKTLGEYAEVAAEDLKTTLADFRTICDRLPHLLWTVDATGQADYFSQSWYDFTGLTEAESLGLAFEQAINPNDMQNIWAQFAVSAATRLECHAEARYRRHDGQWVWMSVKAKPLLDKDGRILKWYGSSTDTDSLVTERLEAERQTTQIMDMLSLAEVGLFEVSPTWHLNVLQGRMFWLEEQQVPRLLTTLNDIQHGGVPVLGRYLQDLMTGENGSAVFEEQIRSRWYKFRLVSDIESGNKRIVQKRVIGCCVDITEQRERAALESENARLITEASLEIEKSRLKTAFLAHMSHEIRTPIAGIVGIADILTDSQLSNEQRDCIGDIQTSANNLLVIVNDILDLSKIEAGKLTFERTEFDLNALVMEVKKPFSHIVRGKPLQIMYNQNKVGRFQMVADPGRVKQIVTNLVSNAVKFTPQGTIEISILAVGSNVNICVEDTGDGIDEQTMTLLFKPFVQGDATTARRHGGTGLGLTISRDLAQSMGGTLNLESVPSKGTKAILTLPIGISSTNHQINSTSLCQRPDSLLMDPSLVPGTNGSILVSPTTTTPTASSTTSDRLVLVVEDNAINQKIALNLVRKLGFLTDAVSNGQEALDYILHHQTPSLILMDCQMPLMDGYQATRCLRTDDKYEAAKAVPVIALTASAIQGDREKCSAAGMDDYLSKPVSKGLLQAMLNKWMPQSQS